ncbi:hypothetical protein HN937_07050 [Candidatus Poribacteria bacterium]|jgi:hypothetical protein|nr:hypothetical protein [Candidatus Poribacteria bacterium]
MTTPSAVLLNPKTPAKRRTRRRTNPTVIDAVTIDKPAPRRRRRRSNPSTTKRGRTMMAALGGLLGGAADAMVPDLPFIDETMIVTAAGALAALFGRGNVASVGDGVLAYGLGKLANEQLAREDGLFGLGTTGSLRTVPTAAIPASSPLLARAAQQYRQSPRNAVTQGLYEADEY